MIRYFYRMDRSILYLFTIFFMVFISGFSAIAGEVDYSAEGVVIPNNYSEYIAPQSTQLKDKESESPKNFNDQKVVTVLPRMIDVSTWQETYLDNEIVCKSNLFNAICLTPEQAENLGW